MTDTDDALAVAQAFVAALNREDQAGMTALLAANVTTSQPLEDGVISGPEAVVADTWSYRNTFPDLQMTVTDGFAAGDRAAVQFTAAGTYEPYTYGPRAKRVTWRGCLIVTAQAGKIAVIDFYTDWLGPLQQLEGEGIVPVLKRESAKP